MDCPVCKSNKEIIFVHPENQAPIFHSMFGADILECTDCKFIFADFIHPETIDLFYKFFCRSTLTAEEFKRLRSNAKESSRSQLKTIKSYLPKKIKRVLDYGGGIGETARLFIPIAEEVYITEREPHAIKHIKEKPRLRLLDEANLLNDSYVGFFDLIIFSNVLEHIAYPISAIQKFSRLLTQNGQLFIEIPNEEPFIRATGTSMTHHISYFSENTLKKLIVREGSFDIEHMRTCGPKVEDMIAAGHILYDFNSQKTPNGWVIRAVLRNARPSLTVSSPSFSLQEAGEMLKRLSRSIFMVNCQRFYEHQNVKPK